MKWTVGTKLSAAFGALVAVLIALAAMLVQPDGPKALLDRAGANTAALKTAMDTAIHALPSVQGGGQTQAGRDLVQLLQQAPAEIAPLLAEISDYARARLAPKG